MEQQSDPFREFTERLIGGPIQTRRKRPTAEDHRKSKFLKIIEVLQKIMDRDDLMQTHLNLNLDSYDEIFFTYIQLSLEFMFPAVVSEIVMFYLQDRFDEDGNIRPLKIGDLVVQIMDVEHLWILVNELTTHGNASKKTKDRGTDIGSRSKKKDPIDPD